MAIGNWERGRSSKLHSKSTCLDHHYTLYLIEVDIFNLLEIYERE